MVAGDPYIDLLYRKARVGLKTIVQSSANGFDRLVDVKHLPVLHTVGVGFSESKYFEFAELILPSGDHCDLGGPDIQADDNGLFVVHKGCF